MSKLLKKLNNYPEFKTVEGIESVVKYIRSDYKTFPSLNKTQSTKFITKFGPHSGFRIYQNALMYSPSPTINIRVARPNERDEIMKRIYHDPSLGQGSGLATFYHKIASQYLNITKKTTDEFLRNQANYQLAKTPHI